MKRLETNEAGVYYSQEVWAVRVSFPGADDLRLRRRLEGRLTVRVTETSDGPILAVYDPPAVLVLHLQPDEFETAVIFPLHIDEALWLQGCARNGDD